MKPASPGAPPISEKDWARTVVEYAELMGWTWTHFRPAMSRNGKWATHLSGHGGFPDIVAIRGGRVLFIELKTEKGRFSDGQTDWGERLLLAATHNPGVEYLIWRPADWSEVQRVLGR